jgi:uncharacterized membrane protein YcfT
MDALRGMALLLVILDHSLFFAVNTAENVPAWASTLSQVFNPLRMPLMVFLSGMLLTPSLRKGPQEYVAGKVRNILYPYVLWSALYTAIWVLASPITGTPHYWDELWLILYDPQGHMWFLYYLFLFYLIMLALRPVPRLAVAALALAISGLGQYGILEIGEGVRFLFLLGFFALGDTMAQRQHLIESWLGSRAVVTGMAVVSLGLPAAAFMLEMGMLEMGLRYRPESLPLALAGIGTMILFAAKVGDRPGMGLFRYVGRNSLPAYILHWMILAVSFVFLKRILATDQGLGLLIAACSVGVVGTLAALYVIQRLDLHWLFNWPKGAVAQMLRGSPERKGSRI